MSQPDFRVSTVLSIEDMSAPALYGLTDGPPHRWAVLADDVPSVDKNRLLIIECDGERN